MEGEGKADWVEGKFQNTIGGIKDTKLVRARRVETISLSLTLSNECTCAPLFGLALCKP